MWDPFGNLAREKDTSGNFIAKYYYDTAGRLVAGYKSGGYYYYVHTNLRGDVISLTSYYGGSYGQYQYDPWGRQISSTCSLNQPFRYAGYYYDEETGLYYCKSRYYSPTLGRFLTKDSIAYINLQNPKTLNPYVYANNNPVSKIDPSGNDVGWADMGSDPYGYNEDDGQQKSTDIAITEEEAIGQFIEEVVVPEVKPVVEAILDYPPIGGKIVPGVVLLKSGVKETGKRIFNITKQESPIWKGLDNYRNGIKTSGSGRKQQYFIWDHTHNDIEVFNHKGLHRGSMNPITGEAYKGGVKGRSIDI